MDGSLSAPEPWSLWPPPRARLAELRGGFVRVDERRLGPPIDGVSVEGGLADFIVGDVKKLVTWDLVDLNGAG